MPESPPPAPEFLSWVPRRGIYSAYKFHKNVGHAKNAIRQGGYGKIWQWKNVAGLVIDPMCEWVLLYDVAPNTKYTDLPWNIEKATLAREREAVAAQQEQRRRAEAYVKELEGL